MLLYISVNSIVGVQRSEQNTDRFDQNVSSSKQQCDEQNHDERSLKHVLPLVHSRFQCVFIASLKFAFMSSYVLPRLPFSSIGVTGPSCKALSYAEDKSSGMKLNR